MSFTALRICATVRLCDAAVIRAPDDHDRGRRGGPRRTVEDPSTPAWTVPSLFTRLGVDLAEGSTVQVGACCRKR